MFDDGRKGTVDEVDELPEELYGFLVAWYDPPGASRIAAAAVVLGTDPPFRIEVGYAGPGDEDVSDDPGKVALIFSDDTALEADLLAGLPPNDRWTAGVANGLVQQQLEVVVTLARDTDLVGRLPDHDRRIAEALLNLLGEFASSSDPPRGVVREGASWLWRKVDVFLDEAARTAGKVAGAVGVGVAGATLSGHFPDLAERLKQLVEIAR